MYVCVVQTYILYYLLVAQCVCFSPSPRFFMLFFVISVDAVTSRMVLYGVCVYMTPTDMCVRNVCIYKVFFCSYPIRCVCVSRRRFSKDSLASFSRRLYILLTTTIKKNKKRNKNMNTHSLFSRSLMMPFPFLGSGKCVCICIWVYVY